MEFKTLYAGIFSGFIQTILSFPFDTIKTWNQNKNICKTPEFTMKNLYNGIKYPLIQTPLSVGSGFFINENVYNKYNNIYFSSFCAGLGNVILFSPLDYYRINLQQQQKPNFYKCYRNLPILIIRDIPSSITLLSSYKFLRDKDVSITVSGALSGVLTWTIIFPLDTIKTRLQANTSFKIIEVIKMGNLYNGLHITCIRAAFVNAIGFYIFELFKK